jgi:hypothetical protein
MDCSICFEAITAQTGSTTMACSHSFHFGCLVKWFGSQADKNLHESCPCCRHEATEHERLPEGGEAEEDDEDSEEESDDDDEEESDESLTLLAQQKFMIKKDMLSETAFHAYAATRIQAAWRAYLPRISWVQHQVNVEQRKCVQEALETMVEQEVRAKRAEALHKLYMTSSRMEWRHISASMFQRAWRGYVAGQKAIKMALIKGYKINWTFKGDHWRRSFLRHSETWYPDEGLPPQSLMFQNHALWTRIQAVWRGHSVRKNLGPGSGLTACERVWARLGEMAD